MSELQRGTTVHYLPVAVGKLSTQTAVNDVSMAVSEVEGGTAAGGTVTATAEVLLRRPRSLNLMIMSKGCLESYSLTLLL